MSAQPRTPDPDSPEDEVVNWWEMRRSGFEIGAYKEALFDAELDPRPPHSTGLCRNCPIGYPRVYRPGETELISNKQQLPIVPAYQTVRGVFHSKCGDRFLWVPRHARVERRTTPERW